VTIQQLPGLDTVLRTVPLTEKEIARYDLEGFLQPIHVLTEADTLELKQAISEYIDGSRDAERYELTDPIRIRTMRTAGSVTFEYVDGETSEKLHTFPFLFNLWKRDKLFRRIGMNPVIAGMARQLLRADQVLLMEDNVVVKQPHTAVVPWHQDFSYWPLAKPDAVTVWIALDDVDVSNGAMRTVPRSHTGEEYLPVSFKDASAFMEARELPELPQNVEEQGLPIVTYRVRAGECGFHHPLVWHGSTSNQSNTARCALVLRYVTSGSTWLGAARMPYDDIGCEIGDPLGPEHFPLVETAF
jgi:phytanoyl-CoA hydroxylase